MKDILSSLLEWEKQGKAIAIATVLQTWGSSPRQSGAHMAIDSDGIFVGSVSGGCVETAVIQESLAVISTGKSKRIKYGVSDETAWEAGLACGGEIEIFISRISWRAISPIIQKINCGDPCWYQIVLDDTGNISKYEDENYLEILSYLDTETSPARMILYTPPDSELVIVGGVNISQYLVDFSKLLGYKITLIDPRKAFANLQRFPNADNIINLWPEEAYHKIKITQSTAIAILTHDDKIDIPAMRLALESPAFYIGALGSKKTQTRRKKALLDLGVPMDQLERIYGPIGLNIGAKNPLEIALAIMAEITAAANKKQR